jgi:rhodanese-related sulfurtransferase
MQPIQAKDLLNKAVFLDVREPFEFEAGHIEGSVHIPIGQIAQRIEEVPSDESIVVVCQIGQRSALVADFLTQRGLDAQNLEGGLEAWTAQGLPLEGGAVVEGWARDLSGERLNPD